MSVVTYSLPASVLAALTELVGTLPAEQRTPAGLSVRKVLNIVEGAVESQDAQRKLTYPRLCDPHDLCPSHPHPQNQG